MDEHDKMQQATEINAVALGPRDGRGWGHLNQAGLKSWSHPWGTPGPSSKHSFENECDGILSVEGKVCNFLVYDQKEYIGTVKVNDNQTFNVILEHCLADSPKGSLSRGF